MEEIWIDSDGQKRTANLTQRLDSGAQVELVLWREDDLVQGAPSDSVTELQIVRAGSGEDGQALVLLALPDGRSRLSLRAPIPLDSLKTLALRVRPLLR